MVSQSNGDRSSSIVSLSTSSSGFSLLIKYTSTFITFDSNHFATVSVIWSGAASSPKFLTYWIILGLLSVISSSAEVAFGAPFAGAAAFPFPPLTGSSADTSTGSSPSIWTNYQSFKKPQS